MKRRVNGSIDVLVDQIEHVVRIRMFTMRLWLHSHLKVEQNTRESGLWFLHFTRSDKVEH